MEELRLVANAVRHGEGKAAAEVLTKRPDFWSHLTSDAMASASSFYVGDMRLEDEDLLRYGKATLEFWAAAGASSVVGY